MERVKRRCRSSRAEGATSRGAARDKLAQRTAGEVFSTEGASGPCVVCRRRSERRRLERACGPGPGSLRLAQQQQVSQRSAWPSHASAGREGAGTFSSDWGDSTESDGLGNESRRASVNGPFGVLGGEFDPGSGSTLAACLMHASRARTLSGVLRGGRVRNTWATCPGVGDSRGKPRVIPHTFGSREGTLKKGRKPARGGACGRLAGWWGHGLPRR